MNPGGNHGNNAFIVASSNHVNHVVGLVYELDVVNVKSNIVNFDSGVVLGTPSDEGLSIAVLKESLNRSLVGFLGVNFSGHSFGCTDTVQAVFISRDFERCCRSNSDRAEKHEHYDEAGNHFLSEHFFPFLASMAIKICPISQKWTYKFVISTNVDFKRILGASYVKVETTM